MLDGHILRANGSSLGADNAVGLCNMMALMEADDLRHPPLELLFTTREEVGLEGIRQFDMTQLRSRRMLNTVTENVTMAKQLPLGSSNLS